MENDREKSNLRLLPEAISRRREQFGGVEYLSDWQVHSANIAAGSIGSLASGFETGPIYVPMPTGSGKTTGAIWGIIRFVKEYPEQRLCFLTPYKSSVDYVHRELEKSLGSDLVGHYHGDTFFDKENELKKRVIVLTHQFIQFNHGRLDDRDIFVIDEAIYATGEATLKLEHFAQARSWATRNGVMAEEFEKLSEFAIKLDRQLRISDKKYVAATYSDEDTVWARSIAHDLQLAEYSQTIDNFEVLVAAQRFCEALIEGLVFLSKGNLDSERYDPIYSAAVLGIPRIDKTVILSATGGMVYDIAGPFRQDLGSREHWTPPSYEQLTLTHLTGPDIKGQYKTWSSQARKEQVLEYVDWVFQQVKELNAYVTLPKQVIEGCLRQYLGLPARGEIDYPIKTTKHCKDLYISHHALSVGSSQFKDCEAVVYLWENHLPQAVSIQRFHTLANDKITDEALKEANGGHLVGNYKRIREAQYIDNMMQQIGRGAVRKINEHAVAGKMTAYVHCHPARFERLAAQYKDCTTTSIEYDKAKDGKPLGRIEQILHYIRTKTPNGDIPVQEIEDALGFEIRRYKDLLQDDWDIMKLGYKFNAGSRGKGKAGCFKYIGDKN